MYISEIVIDGFKSYAHRTTIGPFDQQFNAITGLNGSGKSNILDAICFVLGITQLSQVRVANLQQLIFKNGQAGVRKASVCIVFNNADKQTSPPGYEHCPTITVTRQVAVGGKTKYLINGHVKQQSQVQDLFRSVQLNVNNPHFLIMQGRITKVLNMKPPEVLAMLAEAAGVMLYEAKKNDARKTMTKKQGRVDEITKVLVEDITPTLETLSKQQKNYDLWNKVKMEMEALQRFLIAYEYFRACQFLEKGAATQQKDIESLEKMKARQVEAQEELAEVVEELEKIRGTSELREVEKEVSSLSKDVVSRESTVKHEKEALANEKKQLKAITASIKELEGNMATATKQLEEKKAACQEKEKENEKWQQSLAEAQRQYQSASTGMIVTEDGEDKTLTQELMEKKREVTSGESQIKEFQMRHKHLQSSLTEKRKLAKKGTKSNDLEEKYDASMRKLNSLQQKILDVQFNPEEECRLRSQLSEEEQKVKSLQRKVSDLRVDSFDFKYSNPSSNFDNQKVKGLVGTLLSIKDLKGATALEVGAGGRLYQVVVDNEMTAKALLQKGQLRKRVTIIPLNKIDSSSLSGDKLRRAESLVGKENATVALELIDFDSEVSPAMKYVFGKFFVCSDSESAKAVTFDKNILAKSVTLEGDVYDPSGTITGGSRAQTGSNLVKAAEFNEAKRAYTKHQANVEELKKALASMAKSKEAYSKIEKEISMTSHQTTLLKESLNQTEFQRLALEVESLEKEASQLDDSLKEKKRAIEEATERIQLLEEEMSSAPKSKEDLVKKADSRVKEVKKKMVAASKEYKVALTETQKIEFEISDLKEELDTMVAQKEACEANIEKINERIAKSVELLKQTKLEFQEKNKQLNESKDQLQQTIAQLEPAKNKLETEVWDLTEKIQKMEHKINSFDKDRKAAENSAASITKEHRWVSEEKHLFNRPKSQFDFQGKDIAEVRERVKKLREQEAKLAGSINKKVKDMIDTAEDKYKLLKERTETLEKDKANIEMSIADLDKKKNEALEGAFGKVNSDMGKIFETLLPGAVAKLEPIRDEGTKVLTGLEVKVAFGGVWKESLSELSGGQRSLLALSLILSILLFKPAPMYVLDEIDAALDLSHTQNIGHIIRTHFSKSQFVIVSLKEGMFNNANCLFRVKGVNGISQVTRTAKKKK